MATPPALYWYQQYDGYNVPTYFQQLDACVRQLCAEASVTAPTAQWYSQTLGSLNSLWTTQIDTAVRAVCVVRSVTPPVSLSGGQTYGQFFSIYQSSLDTAVRACCDTPPSSGLRFVLPRATMAGGFVGDVLYDTNLTAMLTRTYTPAPNLVRLCFYNAALGDTSLVGELDNANNITVRAAIERIGGTTIRVTFNGGDDSVVMAPGDIVTSDAWTGTLTANTNYCIRTETKVAAGGDTWPAAFITGSSVGGRSDQTVSLPAAAAADQVYATGAIDATGGTTALTGACPFAIIGTYANGFTSTNPPAIMLAGDSIFSRQNAATLNWFSSNGGTYGQRACRSRQCAMQLSVKAGTQGWQYASGNGKGHKFLFQYASQVYWEYSTNDFGSQTAASLYAYVSTLNGFAVLAQPNIQFIQLRTTPRAGSDNGFIDIAGETPPRGGAVTHYETGGVADQFYALCQAGPMQAYDASIAIRAPAPNQDVWLPATPAFTATDDGLHPNNGYHILLGTQLFTGDTQFRGFR